MTNWTGKRYPAKEGTKLAQELAASAQGTYELAIMDVIEELERLVNPVLVRHFQGGQKGERDDQR